MIDLSSIPTLDQEFPSHEEALRSQGSGELMGLAQKGMPRLDRATLGLRGLMLLAAAPNVGKTALSVQVGLDLVRNNPDACFLFLSLEMPRRLIVSRMLCNLARIDWSGLGRGLEAASEPDLPGPAGELGQKVARASRTLREAGRRIMILDHGNCPVPTVETVVEQMRILKQKTGAERGLILIDYLQVFPIPSDQEQDLQIHSEEEANRWRVGAMKDIRDLSGDPVMVISEMHAGSGEDESVAMRDVVGSPRAIYTPDMVFLLQPLPEAKALREIGGDPATAKREMLKLGIAFHELHITKGRDGVTRTVIPLTFFYRQTRFVEGFRKFSM